MGAKFDTPKPQPASTTDNPLDDFDESKGGVDDDALDDLFLRKTGGKGKSNELDGLNKYTPNDREEGNLPNNGIKDDLEGGVAPMPNSPEQADYPPTPDNQAPSPDFELKE